MPKRTYQPKKRRALKKYGFLSRSRKRKGKKIIKLRRRKGRVRLSKSSSISR